MRAVPVLTAAAVLLAACATPPAGSDKPMADGGDDCAVIAAIASQYYRIGPSFASPPVWEGGESLGEPASPWACDWARWSLPAPPVFDATTSDPARSQWVWYGRPRYFDERTVIVATAIKVGAIGSAISDCRLTREDTGWVIRTCESRVPGLPH